MNKNNSYKVNKNKIIFLVLTLVVLISSLSFFINYSKQDEVFEHNNNKIHTLYQNLIDGKIITMRKTFKKRLEPIMHSQKFRKYLQSQNLHKLNQFLKLQYYQLKSENEYIRSLQFISSKEINSQTSDQKQIVTQAYTKQRAHYGFTVENSKIFYRVVVPISQNNSSQGVLILDADPSLYMAYLTLVSEDIRSFVYFKGLSKHRINSKLFSHIYTQDYTNKQKLVFSFEKQSYILDRFPLLSFTGEEVGAILVATKNTQTQKFMEYTVYVTIINQLLLIGVLFFIFHYAFEYYEKKIKKLTQHEKEQERLLSQQSKMVAMGEMIGNIAHQWRQPLSTVSSAASGMKVQKEFNMLSDELFDSSVDEIMKQTQYMSKTIDDFRDFFQDDEQKVRFVLYSTLQKSLEMFEQSLEESGIELDMQIDNSIELFGYQNKISQAILNIINNAKEQLILKNSLQQKIIQLTASQEPHHILICIQDNAGGISEKISNKVFEPYFTTKHQSQGTGLGLFMSSQIINKNFHGNLDVQNKRFHYKNRSHYGARFIITLPLSNLNKF